MGEAGVRSSTGAYTGSSSRMMLLFCNLRVASKRQVATLWRISLENLELLFAIEIRGGFISGGKQVVPATACR
jgi:hypothetical protein